MSDYEKIAKAITYIRENVGSQPSLEDISAHVFLSPYHFQRLFSRWAGVSPKRFLQVLTLERAKSLLHQSDTTALDASYALGLSSGSRLYDHFVQIEAVTPSEYKARGRGLIMHYGYHDTPFGEVFIAQTPRGICKFCFIEQNNRPEPLHDLRRDWPFAEFVCEKTQTERVIEQLFASQTATVAPLSLWIRGTNFQIHVWKALLTLQSGQLTSYGNIAKLIGQPKAYRAVGTAIGANPVALVIPCHRVIRQTGELGGYRWGETRKHAILARETAQVCEP